MGQRHAITWQVRFDWGLKQESALQEISSPHFVSFQNFSEPHGLPTVKASLHKPEVEIGSRDVQP